MVLVGVWVAVARLDGLVAPWVGFAAEGLQGVYPGAGVELC